MAGEAHGSTSTSAARRVAILINPSSGKDEPILAPINRALAEAGIDWDAFILKPGAADVAVEKAVEARPDAFWVYGGDGTISNVASALLKLGAADRPVAVLGGGTANALADALGAPGALDHRLERLCAGAVAEKRVDVGMVGDRAFLLRATIGAVAGMTNRTTREEKDRLGLLAYALSSLRALGDARPQRFRIDVDGEVTEHEAISVIVANFDGTGLRAALASDVEAQDRFLDIFVVHDAGWVTRALGNAVLGDGLMDGCARFRGQRIDVAADDPADVHLDGEPAGRTPVTMTVRAAALNLLHYLPAAD